MVQRVKVAPPGSRLGPIEVAERRAVMDQSLVKGVYEVTIDRVSAYEMLEQRGQEAAAAAGSGPAVGGARTARAPSRPSRPARPAHSGRRSGAS
jgi:uncharacterized protein